VFAERVRFRNRDDEILTLWVEKYLTDENDSDFNYVVGWCPELENTMVVHEANIVRDEVKS
jgi:hypothetical protein